VISEIKRRGDMRKRYESQQQQNQGTVKDQILSEAMGGIAGMMPPQMAPQQPSMAPMGAPPMGGMPPQGMPPMAPPQPPMGGIPSIPQGMPPMGMAQGGIVQMVGGGQFPNQLQRIMPSGQPLQQMMDALLAKVRTGEIAYADVLGEISGMDGSSRNAALSYARAVVEGEGAGMEPVGGMTQMDTARLSQAAPQPELEFVYPQEGPQAIRESAQRGVQMLADEMAQKVSKIAERYPVLPRDDLFRPQPGAESASPIAGMLEPAASALAQQVVDEYAMPDTGIRGIFASSASDDLGIAPVGGGDARVQAAGSAEVQSQPARIGRNPFSVPSVVAGLEQNREQAGDFLSGINQRMADRRAAGGNQDMRLMNLPEDAILGGKGEPTMLTEAVTALAGTPGPQDRSNKIIDIAQSSRELGIGPTGPVSNPFGTTKAVDALTGLEEVPVDIERKDLSGILASLTEGGKDTPMPALDFSDLIADSKKQALANAMIQLGAGVASGDVAKGISAAGTAAMKGTADARALDMRSRLAEYQAGREDVRRGEETRRYKEGMTLKREQFNSDVAYRAADLTYKINAASGLDRRALLNSVNDMIKEVNDEIIRAQNLGDDLSLTELQEQLALLKKQGIKYSDDITASLARAEEFPGFEVLGTR